MESKIDALLEQAEKEQGEIESVNDATTQAPHAGEGTKEKDGTESR